MAKGIKTGGRQKGTPNKENPLKGYIRAHSLAYFEPKPQIDGDGNPIRNPDGSLFVDEKGNPCVISDFDRDMLFLKPEERVSAELRLLEFHTPKMKAVEMDLDAKVSVTTIEDMLSDLCNENDDD